MDKSTIEFLEYLANFSEGDNYTITADFLDTMKFAVEDLKRIDEAIEYINNHLRQDILTDFTGASYIQEHIIEPDKLLNILNGDNNEK